MTALGRRRVRVTVMGTTDLHGHVYNWDYFTAAEYSDARGNHVGLAKISTLVKAVRQMCEHTLLIDAGDTIQGTPLSYYYTAIDPITCGAIHPMAAAMNVLGFDAAVLGNHEFDYGIPHLRAWEKQLTFSLLAANALNWDTGEPAFSPYTIVALRTDPELKIGILGLTNPGIAIWSKGHVGGRLRFPGIIEQASEFVPRVRAAGADVVVVAAHSGADTSSSYGDVVPYPENICGELAEQVPGIDAILVGHAHREIVERLVTNRQTGQAVVLTEPLFWGMRLSLIEFELEHAPGSGWQVQRGGARVLNANSVPEDPTVLAAVEEQHRIVVEYVNTGVGRCAAEMPASASRYADSPIVDFVNYVQARAVKEALTRTPYAGLPVLSMTAVLARSAVIPAGPVSIRDIAGVYRFDNTLLGVRLDGGQLRDYLEKSAEYFRQLTGPGPHPPEDVTNNPTDTAPHGVPDHSYDTGFGLDAALMYDIDVARPVGQRIVSLAYAGEPVTPDQAFVVAVNNYRQSGGGNFPHVAQAEVLYHGQVEIRQLLIDYLTEVSEIDPALFDQVSWRLVAAGEPVLIHD